MSRAVETPDDDGMKPRPPDESGIIAFMDHDRLFKELLGTFFLEFIDLFLPDIAGYLDQDFAMVPMSQETYSDLTSGERHIVDLLMRVKFRGEDAYFLIHIENQATPQPDFPKRMFKYFARLTESYDLPVYPVVIFSCDTPVRPEPARYRVAFPNKTVLRFDYTVIQLNRIPWQRFLKQQNPVATALMAKMKMRPQDRPKVKAQCMRLLSSLRLDPAKSELIYVFVDSYLRLSDVETKVYDREVAAFTPVEQEKTMELRSIWGTQGLEQGLQQGREEGRHEGKAETAARLIRKRLGGFTEVVAARLSQLSSEQLDDLNEALLDFTNLSDLDQWFAQHS